MQSTALSFDASVDGSFGKPLEIHEYQFDLREGAQISAEVIEEGSSADLNTRLYLFGPNASLDVGGSFHASTANQVLFPDAGVLTAALRESPVHHLRVAGVRFHERSLDQLLDPFHRGEC